MSIGIVWVFKKGENKMKKYLITIVLLLIAISNSYSITQKELDEMGNREWQKILAKRGGPGLFAIKKEDLSLDRRGIVSCFTGVDKVTKESLHEQCLNWGRTMDIFTCEEVPDYHHWKAKMGHTIFMTNRGTAFPYFRPLTQEEEIELFGNRIPTCLF